MASELVPVLVERFGAERVIDRDRFGAAIADALAGGTGFATGKLGGSERAFLLEPVQRGAGLSPLQLRAFELVLEKRAIEHAGIFPAEIGFLRGFCDRYAADVAELDVIGVDRNALGDTAVALDYHRPPGALIDYLEQEPDRSIPADEPRCWLPHLRGRKVLLVCPFAGFLAERASRETFEAVWAKTGKSWFEPAAVEAVEFPYGFAPSTWERHADALALRDEIVERIAERDYDVALIAAGGLGVPIAVAVKRTGRVGISIGGHLQVLFGVHGRRWLERDEWRERYINDAWTGLPERYLPGAQDRTAEDYW